MHNIATMRLIATLAFLAATVAAIPTEPQSDNAAVVSHYKLELLLP